MKAYFASSLFLSLFLSLAISAHGQSCTTATCNAASPNESDVLAALPSSSNANATVVVNIPAGTGSWSSQTNYSVPSAVTNLTIQGATTVNCTGTAGSSSWSCPASDSTIIEDNSGSGNQLIQITTGSSSSYFRWTGTTFTTESGSAKNNGMIYIVGASHNVRIDHNHINENGQNNSMFQVSGSTLGVVDHNLFSLGGNSNVGNGFRDFATSDGANGDQAWASASNWGSSSFWYLESDYFEGGSPTDCYNGGSLVIRYSTVDNAYVMALHGTKNDAGRGRSCRAVELYHNYMSGSSNANAVIGPNGGSALMWGNNVASGYNHFNSPGAPRNFTGGDTDTSTPNGWGLCGSNMSGGPSSWDGNSPSTTGYPCLDGVGRGQGSLLSGGFPSVLNIVKDLLSWPTEYLEPEYMWMNTLAKADEGYINDMSSAYNRDIYPDCGNAGSACAGAFNGTQGTGYGVLASRPSSCTAGPGGTYGASPTGSYGVAYWATDANSGNGELYVCTSTNNWTAIYQPYTYPHPLAGGTVTSNPTPPPPTGLTSTVN
jgi:hypothetical protein